MSDLAVGDTYKLLLDGVPYSGKIKESTEGELYVEWSNANLHSQLQDSSIKPISFSSTVVYGDVRELLVGFITSDTDVLYKGYIKDTLGGLDETEVGAINTFAPKGAIDSVVVYRNHEGKAVAYMTVDKYAFEMKDRIGLVRILNHKFAVTFTNNDTEINAPVLLAYFPDEIAEEMYDSFNEGETYGFDLIVSEPSIFLGNETYFINDDVLGVSSNYGQSGIVNIENVQATTKVQLNPRTYKGADKLSFNKVSTIGSNAEVFDVETVVVEENGREVFARFVDSRLASAFADNSTTKVFHPNLEPKLGYRGTYILPLIIKGPSIIWDCGKNPLPVDIVDQWQTPIDDFTPATTCLTSLNATRYGSSYLYLLNTSLEAVGMTVDLVTEQLSNTGDMYVPVKYELPIVQHNSIPAIDLNDTRIKDNARHNLLDWIWYLGIRNMPFGFELTPYGKGIEFIGDLLVKASKAARSVVVDEETGILRYPQWPVEFREQPIERITIVDGTDDVTFHLKDVSTREVLIVQHEEQVFMAPIKSIEDK